MTDAGSHRLVAFLGASAVEAAAAVCAVAPWGRCGVTDTRLDAFLLAHPRVEFAVMLLLVVIIGTAWARASNTALRRTSAWHVAPLAVAAWVAFETRAAYLGALPRDLLEYRGLLLWVPFWLIALASVFLWHRTLHGRVGREG